MSRAALIGIGALIAGCAGIGGHDRPGDRYVGYRCAGGQEIGVTYQGGGGRALLVLAGRSELLRHVASASGAKYSDGRTVLWTKGASASVEVDGQTVARDCRETGK